MNDLKYIIVLLKGMVTPSAVMFRGSIAHKSLVPKGCKVITAGFFHLDHAALLNSGVLLVHCYGESTSLGVKSNPIKDCQILHDHLIKNFSYTLF